MKTQNKYLSNEKIRSPLVTVIDSDGNNLGIKDKSQAIYLAKNQGLDLVQVDSSSQYPVCKILDYGKMMYKISKNKQKSKSNRQVVKEIYLGLSIADYDLNIKISKIKKFLSKDHTVKIGINLKGRQIEQKDQALDLMNRIVKALADDASYEPFNISTRSITSILQPK